MTSRIFLAVVSTLILFAIASGCSRAPARGTASGVVTLDGEPLSEVFVVLHPVEHQAPQARGLSNDVGEFVLQADDGEGGVVVGQYRVVVQDLLAPPGPLRKEDDDEPETVPRANRVPPRYNSWEKSPLEVEVLKEDAVLEIPLTTDET
jgi:hypothetical protein